MIQTQEYGTYHATNEGICSWYEFACEIFKQANMDVKVNLLIHRHFQSKRQDLKIVECLKMN